MSRKIFCVIFALFCFDRSCVVYGNDEATIRGVLSGDDRKQLHKLIEQGDKLFPVYESILADPATTPYQVCSLFGVLRKSKGDRSSFLDACVKRCADPEFVVRRWSMLLLESIGTHEQQAPVVAALFDESGPVAHAAAETLAAIGNKHSVVAFDSWLLSEVRRKDKHFTDHILTCRGKLIQRLKKEQASNMK